MRVTAVLLPVSLDGVPRAGIAMWRGKCAICCCPVQRVTGILEYCELVMSPPVVEYVPFQLRNVMEDVFSGTKLQLESRIVTIHVDPTLPTVLIGDVSRIHTVLLQLVTNSLQFTAPHGEVCMAVEFSHLAPMKTSRQRGSGSQVVLHPRRSSSFSSCPSAYSLLFPSSRSSSAP